MSKRVKSIIEKDYSRRLGHVEAVAVINPRGIDANKTNQLRRVLADKGVRMTVVKNTLARRAGGEMSIAGFESLLDGPSAIVYGEVPADGEEGASISSVCRALVDQKKDKAFEELEFRGVFFDGELYHGEAGVTQVSKLPTREEAVAELVGCILGPGAGLAGALVGPGGSIGGILKAIEEKQGGGDENAE
jgi:large subunit ribosomal protein L10